MAESPSHKFGQIIGDVFESSIQTLLRNFAEKHRLFLDNKGVRPAREGKKVSWQDSYGNKHDLDFVLERDGSTTRKGVPAAFIEVAWRRYTKHSRNKAQEIQGAILPLRETYQKNAPFIGTILAGDFTEGALTQLRSMGFAVLYFPYSIIIEAFKSVSINALFDEETPDADFSKKVRVWGVLSEDERSSVARKLLELNKKEVDGFLQRLEDAVTRSIVSVRVLPLHGSSVECNSIDSAIEFIEKYKERNGLKPIIRYEVEIRYSNGDRILGEFAGKEDTVRFLHAYQGGPNAVNQR